MLEAKEKEIQVLQQDIDERNKKIEEYERSISLLSSKASETELIRKYKFDNQILMNKLGEYKKAEKGAKDIVTDYE